MDENVLSLDEVRSSLWLSELLRSTMYKEKRRKLCQKNAERLRRLELRVMAIRYGEPGDELTVDLHSYYECATHVFEDGQIKAYYNQTVGQFTLLDFSLFEPTDGGIEASSQSGLVYFPWRHSSPSAPEPHRRVAAKLNDCRLPTKAFVKKRLQIEQNAFSRPAAGSSKCLVFKPPHTYARFYCEFGMGKAQLENEKLGSGLVELCIETTNTLDSQRNYAPIIRTAFSGDSKYVDHVPDWSLLKYASTQKEIENEFARKLLVGEMLGHISANIELEGAVLGVPIARRSCVGTQERRRTVYKMFLLKKIRRLCSILNEPIDGSKGRFKYDSQNKRKQFLGDDALVHLVRSSIILCFARQLHQDLNEPVFERTSSMSRADVLYEGSRKMRLSTFHLFVNQFNNLCATENLWLKKEDVMEIANKVHVGPVCPADDLASLSSFGSISVAVCGSLGNEQLAMDQDETDREAKLNTLLRVGGEVLGLTCPKIRNLVT